MNYAIFGIGNTADKTLKRYGIPVFAVDNSKATWGTTWNDLAVLSPPELVSKLGEQEIERIVICSTSYKDIITQLIDLGVPEELIEVTTVLDSVVASNEIEDIRFDLLFASGLPSHEKDQTGGGIFRLRGDRNDNSISKLYSGNCHGMSRKGSKVFFTDSDVGVYQLDLSDFAIKKVFDVEKGFRGHGLHVSDYHVYIACSYRDSVVKFNMAGHIVDEFEISDLCRETGRPYHHVNDICVFQDDIYLSMFSKTGSWQNGFLDGCIAKINLKTKSISFPLEQLGMPHNIKVNAEGYHVCNSLYSELRSNNRSVLFRGNGFLRGFFENKDSYIIGESKNRNFASLKDRPLLNACLDTRINFVSKKYGAYVSVQLPPSISEIHSIESLKDV
jgi:hypothetical protein